jgi:FtsZ-interacting cell division protein YlmF
LLGGTKVGLLDIFKESDNATDIHESNHQEFLKDETTEEKVQKFRKKTSFMSESSKEVEIPEIRTSSEPREQIFINKSQQVRICKPKVYAHAETIGQAIKDNKIVILHMDDLDTNTATRILEFVYGICYAYEIEPENIDSKIFMIDPGHKRR